ncbi:MAG: hypothetical protein GY751_00740 [Bacteroidetes bacterium]|nr:hypothetical protein [Bacteroidota bacterium]
MSYYLVMVKYVLIISMFMVILYGCEDVCEECNEALKELCVLMDKGNCDPNSHTDAYLKVLNTCESSFAPVMVGYMAGSCYEEATDCPQCEQGDDLTLITSVLFIADNDLPVEIQFSIPSFPIEHIYDIASGTAISIRSDFEQNLPYSYGLFDKSGGNELARASIDFTFDRPGSFGATRQVHFKYDLQSGYTIEFVNWE